MQPHACAPLDCRDGYRRLAPLPVRGGAQLLARAFPKNACPALSSYKFPSSGLIKVKDGLRRMAERRVHSARRVCSMKAASEGSWTKMPQRRLAAFLRMLICVAIASYGVPTTVAMALSVPFSCDEVMPHGKMASAGLDGVSAIRHASPPEERQGICPQPGCVMVAPDSNPANVLDTRLAARMPFAVEESSPEERAVSPDRRPPKGR